MPGGHLRRLRCEMIPIRQQVCGYPFQSSSITLIHKEEQIRDSTLLLKSLVFRLYVRDFYTAYTGLIWAKAVVALYPGVM